jgi:N utilization substance protein A
MSETEMMDALQALAADKGISVDTLMAALADALESAYKRMPGAHEYAWVTIDPTGFDIRVYAQEIDEDGEPYGPELDVTPKDFGRIAAQTARQVMTQRIREAERELRYEEYAGREGDIVTGTVQQGDSRYTLLSLGPVEALLPQAEQVPHERPEANTRLKAYIVEVRRTAKGPQIVVSRTHPGLVLELFKLEVPEIADGVVEIKACAREPGHRTKIAVWSNDSNVDPVGACVGARGARVRQVVNELRGEKIDIVPFNDDPYEFVARALSPAKVKEVRINEDTGVAEVIVPDYQLSLAIGKEGQNARLSARLTGWRVDIKSESQLAEEETYGQQDWAEGEWVVDPESGEQVWQPAEGGPALKAEDWAAATEGEGGADAAAEAGASDAATEDATTGDATTGDATTEDAATEDATTGDATTGDATTGDAATGDATTGDATTGDATTGDATTEDATTEDTVDHADGDDGAEDADVAPEATAADADADDDAGAGDDEAADTPDESEVP